MSEKKADVKIDRLVLDIPGLDADGAARLAQEIGEHLALGGVAGDHSYVGVSVPAGKSDLAQRIAAALMERLS